MSALIHIVFSVLLITVPVKIVSIFFDAVVNSVADKVIEKLKNESNEKNIV